MKSEKNARTSTPRRARVTTSPMGLENTNRKLQSTSFVLSYKLGIAVSLLLQQQVATLRVQITALMDSTAIADVSDHGVNVASPLSSQRQRIGSTGSSSSRSSIVESDSLLSQNFDHTRSHSIIFHPVRGVKLRREYSRCFISAAYEFMSSSAATVRVQRTTNDLYLVAWTYATILV